MGGDSGQRSAEIAMQAGSDFRYPNELDSDGKTKEEIRNRFKKSLVTKNPRTASRGGVPFDTN